MPRPLDICSRRRSCGMVSMDVGIKRLVMFSSCTPTPTDVDPRDSSNLHRHMRWLSSHYRSDPATTSVSNRNYCKAWIEMLMKRELSNSLAVL